MRSLIKIVIIPLDFLSNSFYFILNLLVFKIKKVNYIKFPKIKGRLIIQNKGKCIIAEGVSFNSLLKSNLVGLCKPCTISVRPGATLTIGANSGFSGITIFCAKQISIGAYVNCGGNVFIWDTDFHPLDFEKRRIHDVSAITTQPITIGNDVFIGANSITLKGVTIGERSIIGAGSVVTKNIPDDEIWAGNPAKFIRKINN